MSAPQACGGALYVRACVSRDLDDLVPHLRAADVEGIRAAQGIEPRAAIERSLADSELGWAFTLAGRVEAVGGVARWRKAEGVGVPWLLGSEALHRHPRMMLIEGRRWVAMLHSRFHTLFNYVDCRNRGSLAWLTHIGFTIARIEPAFGIERMPFALVVSAPRRTGVGATD